MGTRPIGGLQLISTHSCLVLPSSFPFSFVLLFQWNVNEARTKHNKEKKGMNASFGLFTLPFFPFHCIHSYLSLLIRSFFTHSLLSRNKDEAKRMEMEREKQWSEERSENGSVFSLFISLRCASWRVVFNVNKARIPFPFAFVHIKFITPQPKDQP